MFCQSLMYLNSLSHDIQKDVVSTDINDMNKSDGNIILKYSTLHSVCI